MPILSPDEISTIFVVGFPPDVREREFQNLFMFASGFEGASLKVPEQSIEQSDESLTAGQSEFGFVNRTHNTTPQPIFKQQIIGFARFQRRQDALAARDHLNGRCIDVERGCILKVEMAKKNLFIAPRKPSVHSCVPLLREELCGEEDPMFPLIKTTRSLSLSIPGNPAPIDISIPSRPNDLMKSNLSSRNSFSSNSPPAMFMFGENPPCNTLYVGNLPLGVDEDELYALFCNCEGYRRLSFKTKANGPMCFIEFEDVACAKKTMDQLYGTLLSSSTKGGIRLSFSKNPLGVRSSTPTILSSPPSSLRTNASSMTSQNDYLSTVDSPQPYYSNRQFSVS